MATAAVLLLAGCSGGGGPDVATAPVGLRDVVEIVNAPATVAARAQSTVSAPAAGTVAEVLVRDGATVRAGQPLVRVDSPSARERLRQAEAADAQAAAVPRVSTPRLTGFQGQVDTTATAAFGAARQAAVAVPAAQRAQALAAVAQAEAQYAAARAEALASLRSLERGIGSVATALASLGQAQRVQTQAAVTIARSTVDALVVRSPINGTVQLGGSSPSGTSTASGLDALIGGLPAAVQGSAASALNGASGAISTSTGSVVAGTPVDSGTALATVFDLTSLQLVGAVDETDIFLVKPGVRANVELDALPDATFTATVASVDLSPTESSRGGVTYGVRLNLGAGRANDGSTAPRPRPGMSAVVDLRVRSALLAVAVPAASIVRQGARDAVWVVVGGRARGRVVRLGAQGDDYVQVLDGLHTGEVVVTRGADTLAEGRKVP
ncbi:MAG: HlyD family secretion protein [Frankiaceae bacterium]|nr:HlyD family secretion protein [Frankiaceae bacterium]